MEVRKIFKSMKSVSPIPCMIQKYLYIKYFWRYLWRRPVWMVYFYPINWFLFMIFCRGRHTIEKPAIILQFLQFVHSQVWRWRISAKWLIFFCFFFLISFLHLDRKERKKVKTMLLFNIPDPSIILYNLPCRGSVPTHERASKWD